MTNSSTRLTLLAAFFTVSAHAALNQSVNFTVQDSGYTLTGAGGAGVYGTGGPGSIVAWGSVQPSTFSEAPTGFLGAYLGLENLLSASNSIYTDYVAYVNLPAVSGTAAAGSFSFSFKMAAPHAAAERYDARDSTVGFAYANMEYRVDGGAWQKALSVEGRGLAVSPAPTALSPIGMWWDSNFDGILTDADTQITGAATTVSRTITGITVLSSFQARLIIRSTTQEEMAFDDISVSSAAFTAIPEPSTYGLMGAGALGGLAMIRRRRRRAL